MRKKLYFPSAINILKMCGIFFLLSLFSTSIVSAEENNGVLFRVDTRGPDDIFHNGFTSFGENDNVREHSRGRSCAGREQNSAFISVSADPVYTANYARRLYQLTGSEVYVYLIRSTRDMYNMSASLEAVGYSAGIQDAIRQSEWIAHRYIPATTIIGVRIYGDSPPPPVIHNPQLSNESQVINSSPYISLGASIPPILPVYASTRPLVTACMAAMTSCFSSRDSLSKSQCRYVEDDSNITNALFSEIM